MGLRIGDLKDCVDHIFEIDSFKSKMGDDKDIVKNFRSKPIEKTILDSIIPQDAKAYEQKVNESNLDNYKNFFNNSYLEELDMRNDQIRLKKAYAEPIVFEFKDFGSKEEVLERLDEKINVNDFAEIIFLCKYVGDYNITKYGDKLMFENADSALVLKRL